MCFSGLTGRYFHFTREWPRWLARLYRSYFSTWQVSGLIPDGSLVKPSDYDYGAVIFAHSERESLAIACVTNYSPFTVLVAAGRDGDRATAALQSIGCHVVRGSSLSGGLHAMVALTRNLISNQTPAGICIDGPLGPKGRVKDGVLVCAQTTGRPIIPIATAARRRIVFPGTWSGIFLPLPFTKVVISLGDALQVPARAPRDCLRELALELERRLEAARTKAEEAIRCCKF